MRRHTKFVDEFVIKGNKLHKQEIPQLEKNKQMRGISQNIKIIRKSWLQIRQDLIKVLRKIKSAESSIIRASKGYPQTILILRTLCYLKRDKV